ncbi:MULTISPECIES: CGNR zinc finger domain-containing protein [Micrococcaceae]|uniref:CGNR zinc finger domain-containing protein n=1 Tax=Micrococcaceae TaxID=1268 RepID=UPI000BB84FD6|nr:CGNR zinc finger domain-containing protein [Glutamicibacter sp. BW78]PCC24382.1 RNA-binding protein [Glutamicibacter sp. BW78]
MKFAPDTETSLQTVVHLLNTALSEVDGLLTGADLDEFVAREEYTGARTHNEAELRSVRHLRETLRALWIAGEDEAVVIVNNILRNARALPQLVKHDHWNYHLHATSPAAPLAERMAVEAAMAIVDVLRSGEKQRLRICAGSDCEAAVLDLSRNRSKLYCQTGNCANREHVRAYRQRRAALRP